MKKAGIVTIYDVPNFGSVLQAFATQMIISDLGYEPVFIDYNRYNQWRVEHGGATKSSFWRAAIRKIGLKADHRKAIKLENFKNLYFNRTHTYQDLDELNKEDWSDYELFVVGSDQVWNTNYMMGDSFYLLSFVPNAVPKVSIASSFAMKSLPYCYSDKFKAYLQRFSSLSVREVNAKQIINEGLGLNTDVKLLLDPTLLLSGKEWNECLAISPRKKKEKYILFYMWAYAFEPRPYIYEVTKYFQKKLDCKIIALEGCYSTCPTDLKMENRTDSTITEFLHLFANAELVITSSFHGTAFALNYGRPLVSIVPEGGDDRQTSLIENLGVLNCAVKIGTTVEQISPWYDIDSQQKRIESLREDSLLWIKRNCKSLV